MYEIHEELDGYLERYCAIAFKTKEDVLEYFEKNNIKYDSKNDVFYKQIGFSMGNYYIKELKVYESSK